MLIKLFGDLHNEKFDSSKAENFLDRLSRFLLTLVYETKIRAALILG